MLSSILSNTSSPEDKKKEESKFQIVEGRYLKIHDYLFGLGDIPNTPRGSSKLVNISLNEITQLNSQYSVSSSILDFVLQAKHDEFLKKGVKVLTTRTLRQMNSSSFFLGKQKTGQILQEAIDGSAFHYPAVVLPIINQEKWDLYILMHPKKIFNQKIQSTQQKLSELIQTIGGGLGGGKKKKLRHRLIHVMGGKESGLKKYILYDSLNEHFKSVMPGENIQEFLKQPEIGCINETNFPYQPIHIKNQKETGSSGGYLIYSFLSQVFLKNKTLTPDLKNIEFDSWFSNIDEELDEIKYLLDQIPGTRMVEKDGELWVEKRNSFFIGTPETQNKLLDKLKMDMSPESLQEHKLDEESMEESRDQIDLGENEEEEEDAVDVIVSEPTDKAGFGISLDLTKALNEEENDKKQLDLAGVQDIQKKEDETALEKEEETEIKDQIEALGEAASQNEIDIFEDQIGINIMPKDSSEQVKEDPLTKSPQGGKNFLEGLITPKKEGDDKFQIIEGRYLKINDYLFGLGDIPNTPRGRSKLVNISMNQIQELNKEYIVSSSILDFVLQAKHDEFLKKGVKVVTTRVLRQINSSSFFMGKEKTGQILKEGINGSAFNYPVVVLPIVNQEKWDLYIIMHPKKIFNNKMQSSQQKLSDLIQTIGGGLGGGKKKKLRHRLIHVMGGKDSGLKKDIVYSSINQHFKSIMPGQNIVDYLKQPEIGNINQKNLPYQPIHIKNQKETGSSGGYLIYSFLSQVFLKNKTLTPDLKNIEFDSWFSNIDQELDEIKYLIDQIPGTRVVQKDGELWVEKRNSFFIGTPETQNKLLEKLKMDMSPQFIEDNKLSEDSMEESRDEIDVDGQNSVDVIVSEPTDKAGFGISLDLSPALESLKDQSDQIKDEVIETGNQAKKEQQEMKKDIQQKEQDQIQTKKDDKQDDELKGKKQDSQPQNQKEDEQQEESQQIGIMIDAKLSEIQNKEFSQQDSQEKQAPQKQNLADIALKLNNDLMQNNQNNKDVDDLNKGALIDKQQNKQQINEEKGIEQQQLPHQQQQKAISDDLKEKGQKTNQTEILIQGALIKPQLEQKAQNVQQIFIPQQMNQEEVSHQNPSQQKQQLTISPSKDQKDKAQQKVKNLADNQGALNISQLEHNTENDDGQKQDSPKKQLSDQIGIVFASKQSQGQKQQEPQPVAQQNDQDKHSTPQKPSFLDDMKEKAADFFGFGGKQEDLKKQEDEKKQDDLKDKKQQQQAKEQSDEDVKPTSVDQDTQKHINELLQTSGSKKPQQEQQANQQQEHVNNEKSPQEQTQMIGFQFQVPTQKVIEPVQGEIERVQQAPKIEQVMVESSAPMPDILKQEELKAVNYDDELKLQLKPPVSEQFITDGVERNNNDPENLPNTTGGDQQTSKTQDEQSEEEQKAPKQDKQVAEQQSQTSIPDKLSSQKDIILQPISHLSLSPQVEVPECSESQIKLSNNNTARLYTQTPTIPVSKPHHFAKSAALTAKVKFHEQIPFQEGQQEHGSDSWVTDPNKVSKIVTQNPPGFVRSAPPMPKDDANISKDLDITPPNDQIIVQDRNSILNQIPSTPQKVHFSQGENHKNIKLDVESDLNSGRFEEKDREQEEEIKGFQQEKSVNAPAEQIFTNVDDNLTSSNDLKPNDMIQNNDKLVGVRLPSGTTGYENRSPLTTDDSPQKIEAPSEFKKKEPRRMKGNELEIQGNRIRSSRQAGCCGQCRIL